MAYLYRLTSYYRLSLTLTMALFFTAHVNAHVMVAQHGTLNLVEDGAFMVLSLPVSGFNGIDNDLDGKLSLEEFNQHRFRIGQQVKKHVRLTNANGLLPLKGLMISPVADHHAPNEPVSQVVIMGKFIIENTELPLAYHVNLFGKFHGEQEIKITATRRNNGGKRIFSLNPKVTSAMLFHKDV
ncbi:hypothetical protein [Thalassotalea sp. PLHSN55]|uniref:hypothetical protein n=1 Tax=Thalassotalea sp. PLHSN55 TaxID=3435888 RepID=UPI003F8625DA